MATTVKQDRDFIDNLISSDMLELAIEWIRDNLEPEDVFTDEQLGQWAVDSDYLPPTDSD